MKKTTEENFAVLSFTERCLYYSTAWPKGSRDSMVSVLAALCLKIKGDN